MTVEALKSDLLCPQMDTEDCCQDSDIDWDSDESMGEDNPDTDCHSDVLTNEAVL